jgi:hypothetical protein
MACECITLMDEKLAERNTRLLTTIVFGKPQGYLAVTLASEKIAPRNRDKVTALPTFCPFCGVRYVPEAAPTHSEPTP